MRRAQEKYEGQVGPHQKNYIWLYLVKFRFRLLPDPRRPTGLGIRVRARFGSDSVPDPETVATLATATVSNVLGMIGTEAGLKVQVVAMKNAVVFTSSKSSSPIPFLITHRPARQDRRAVHPRSVYILPQCPIPRLALRQLRVRDSPLQHPRSPGRRVAGAYARTRPAPPVDATQIRARPRGPAVSGRNA